MEESRKMKILFIGPEIKSPKTGGERYLAEVMNYFKNHDVKVEYLGLPGSYKYSWKGFLFTNLWYIRKFLRIEAKRDYVLLEDYGLGRYNDILLNFLVKIVWGNKIVTVIQSFYFPSQKSITKNILDWCVSVVFLKQAGLVVGGGGTAIVKSIVKMGVPKQRVVTIAPGVEESFLRIKPVNRDNRGNRELNLLFVGRFSPNKGLEYLIRAVDIVRKEPFRLIMVGDMEYNMVYGRSIISMVEDLGLSGKVTYCGRINDMNELIKIYKDADVFILPSVEECYPFVLLESMCSGLPVIATDVASVSEIVEDMGQGMVVPPKDPDALADAIRKMIHNPQLRISMGRSSSKRADKLVKKWDVTGREFYRTLIEKRIYN